MNILDSIQEKINKIKENNNNYQNQINNSNTFQNLIPIPESNIEPIEYKINLITNTCPDINKDKALIISKLIPINETYLTIMYTKEVLTNIEYYIIPTNKYIWIITNTNYIVYNYPTNPICTIIKNILMGKIINFNNIILEITGTDTTINNFINIINNKEYRDNAIKEKTNYLCNIIPNCQLINKNGFGISIDKENNIVFHTKDSNYKYNKEDITNYELLFDNSIVYSKTLNSTTRVTSSHNECYTISLRITTKDKTFTMPILEPNSLNTKYTKQEQAFQDSQTFAYKIIEKLNILTNPYY